MQKTNEPEKKEIEKNTVVKQEKPEQEITDAELNQASGGVQAVRDGRAGHGGDAGSTEEGHWWTAGQTES